MNARSSGLTSGEWMPSGGAGKDARVPCYTGGRMAAPIRALIFDLDDTLVVEEASAEAAFLETGELARTRYGIDPAQLHTRLRRACRELWYAFPSHPYCKKIGVSSWEGLWAEFIGPDPELAALRAWAPRYRRDSWLAALRQFGIDDAALASELGETFPRVRRQKHIVYPDVFGTLEMCARSFRLGLLTNGAVDLQERKIAGSGIARFFDEVLISGAVGLRKPNPRLFEILLGRLAVGAEAALMIGNNLESDIEGAQRAGMRAVWVNRSGERADNGVVPDWEISSLEELNAVLESLSAS